MMRAGFEGGQNPIAMAMGKQRGPHKKTSMPFGPFRTVTTGVNLRDIARRFESGADVTPELMLSLKVVRSLRHPIKVLAVGELPGPMQIRAHGFSAAARQKIEAAGGSATVIEELEAPAAAAAPDRTKKASAPTVEDAAPEAVVDEIDEPADAPSEAAEAADDEAEA
jgi:ribosomal protein L15